MVSFRLMLVEAQLLQRVDALVSKGRALFQYHPNDRFKSQSLPIRHGAYTSWRTQCLTLLTDLLGETHSYAQEFRATVPSATRGVALENWVESGLGILHAMREDIDGGYLTSLKTLVSAEVFLELLDQAEYLLKQSYKDAAASVTGALLENGLRRIAVLKGVKVKAGDDLNALDNRCAQAQVYSVLARRKLQVWITVRNNADHGHFNEYLSSDVEEMISGVRGFLGDYLR